MSAAFDPDLSLAIDRAIVGLETTTGVRHLLWSAWLSWLCREVGK